MMDEKERAKERAAKAALDELPMHGVLGLGTGSTAKLFIDGVGQLVREGRNFRAVPTSQASRQQANSLQIAMLDDEGPWTIDVCVDGADEVDEAFHLIKGGGGALTREKIVNAASKKNVCIVDASKLSKKLGTTFKLPIEVLSFAHRSTAQHLSALGPMQLRMRGGEVFRTDSSNVIYDVQTGPISDPAQLERQIKSVPGVVEVGLFIHRIDILLIADLQGVKRIECKP